MKVNSSVDIYTDGSSLRNPGASGLAYIIRYWVEPEEEDGMPKEETMEGSQGYRLSTNNRMEIMAAIQGLRCIIDKIESGSWIGVNQINLNSDSEYLCKSINQKWIAKWMQNNWMTSGFGGKQPKLVKNKDLWEAILAIQDKLRSLNINLVVSHVMGHNGDELNERADKLAVAASNNTPAHIVDEFYEKGSDR